MKRNKEKTAKWNGRMRWPKPEPKQEKIWPYAYSPQSCFQLLLQQAHFFRDMSMRDVRVIDQYIEDHDLAYSDVPTVPKRSPRIYWRS